MLVICQSIAFIKPARGQMALPLARGSHRGTEPISHSCMTVLLFGTVKMYLAPLDPDMETAGPGRLLLPLRSDLSLCVKETHGC